MRLFIVSPHPDGGWRVTGPGIGPRGIWYDEAKRCGDYAEHLAGVHPYRIELQNRAGAVLKVREGNHEPDHREDRAA